ncbi:MAG TPA: ABC transporter permease [Cyclobacteriaceae bacterium]|nr:ABC transporter permease [Cyclobacteriaceae bacterium]
MTKNLLLIALRVLLKQRTSTVIKIGGLAVGFASCVLIILYVNFEYSYDSFHQKRENIFRIVEDVTLDAGNIQVASAKGPVGPALANDFSEVRRTVRFASASMLMKYGENHFQEDNVYFADSTVFDVFTFPILKGDPSTALTKPESIVLTRRAAQRYFGNEDPMNQVMIIDNEIPFTVTGVIEDIPGNSHLQFDILLSMSTRGSQWLNTWGWSAYTYIETAPGTEIESLRQKLPKFASAHKTEMLSGGEKDRILSLQPVEEIHLHSKRAGEPGTPGNPSNLLLFSIVTLLVLIIACVNFINLTTAQAASRAREVGIRKVIGGTRVQLANQFLMESVLMSVTASVIALASAYLLLPSFTTLTGTPVSFDLLLQPSALALYFSLAVVIGCIAGWYPALVLSGFRPAAVLKGSFKMSTGGVMRESLVVVQFSISIAFVVGTIAVYSQLSFMQHKELGYDQEQVLVIYFGDDENIQQKTESIKQELLRSPQLAGAAASSHVPGREPGKTRAEMISVDGENKFTDVSLLAVDFDFFSFYKIPMVAGRMFSPGIAGDTDGLVVNESALGHFGFANPDDILNRELTVRGQKGTVIGVARDFHYASLHKSIEPMVVRIRAKSLSYMSLKVEAGGVAGLVDALESEWNKLAPTRPFDYFFLDEQFDRQYRTDRQFGQLFAAAAGISIVLACLGLFGLVSFIVEQRTKEIGIRKVLGAPVAGIVAMLSMNFMKLIVISILIATAMSWYTMDKWLQEFPYRIEMQWWMFTIAGGAGLVVALLTISLKSVKAATANPVESLKRD